MIDELIQWATLLSPIISVIAVIVALRVANNSLSFVGGARIDHIIAGQEKAQQNHILISY